MAISFVLKKTPAPPELILDYDSEISFNNTTEDFPAEGLIFGAQTDNCDAIQNGSILVSWIEYLAVEEGVSFYNLKNIDLIGSDDFSKQATISADQVATENVRLGKLSNDPNVAIGYTDSFMSGEGTEYNGRFRLQVVGATTGNLASNTIVKTVQPSGICPLDTLILPLNNGNVVFAYKQLGETFGTLFTIYGYSSNTLSALYTDIEISSELDVTAMRGVVLDSGDFVIAFGHQIDDSGRGSGYSVKMYDDEGTLIDTVYNSSDRYLENGLSVVATDDGGFVLCVADVLPVAGGEGGEGIPQFEDYPGKIYLRKFSSAGLFEDQVEIDFPETDPGGSVAWGSIMNVAIFKLDSGDIGLVGINYPTKKLFTYVINQSLTTVQQPLTLLSKTINEISGITVREFAIAKFSDGKYGYVCKRKGPSGARVYVDVLTGGASE